MATAIQRRRGTTAQHSTFTGLAGEITIDTTLNTVIVHDGSTAGGIRLAKYSEVQSAAEGDITAVTAGSGLTGGAATGNATLSLDYENLSGNLVPSANNTYSLGSLSNVWKDVYIGPGSLYVNGSKVIEDSSGTIQFTADTNQNISILTTGTGDIELTTGGEIQLKSNVVLSSGKVITTAGGAATTFTSNVNMNSNNFNNVADPVAAQDAATKAYVDAASYLTGGDGVTNTSGTIAVDSTVVRTTGAQTIAGAKTFSDNMFISGNLSVSGTTTTVNSETISLADNIIDLNSNFTSGVPSENAGIKVKRGDSSDVQVRWNETSDAWEFTNDGSTYSPMPTDTDDLTEGASNLYFTNARAQGAISVSGDLTYSGGTVGFALSSHDTDDLTEGASNLYFTNARADTRFDTKLAAATTDNLTEGSTNLYYTSVRANADFDTKMAAADTDDLSEGATNLYYTTARANAAFDVKLTAADTDDLSEGATNLYYTTARWDTKMAAADTGDLSEGSNLYYTTARANSAIDAYLTGGTGIAVNSGVISLTDTGYISGVTAGSGLTGGGASGNVTLNIGAGTGITVNADDIALSTSGVTGGTYGSASGSAVMTVDVYGRVTSASTSTINIDGNQITSGTIASARLPDLAVSDFGGAAIQTGAEAFSDSDTVLMTAAAIQDKIESYGYSTTVGDITGVTAGTNLNGGGSSGAVTVNLDTTLTGMTAATFSGTVTANLFSGTATAARYADLAEKYETDEILEAGTVVCFGGDREVTACAHEADHAVAGVISTDPAYMMNSDAEGQYVALAGRVPCKVVGPVAKGDLLVTSEVKGHAKADNTAPAGRIIGKAIGSVDSGEAVIEVLVNMM